MCARTRLMAGSECPFARLVQRVPARLDQSQGFVQSTLLAIDRPEQDGQARSVDPRIVQRVLDDLLRINEAARAPSGSACCPGLPEARTTEPGVTRAQASEADCVRPRAISQVPRR